MNGLESTIYTAAVTKLGSIASLKMIGEYPYQVNEIGQRVPAALIEIGDVTDAEHRPGMVIAYTQAVNVWLYHRPGANDPRGQVIAVHDAIISAMSSVMAFVPQVAVLRWSGTDKGESSGATDVNLFSPGYTAAMHVWRIRFTMQILDSRS